MKESIFRKGIKLFQVEEHSDEWHKFREDGIGGSESGTILGLDKYSTPVRVYYEKIGDYVPFRQNNQRMFWGHMNEDNIADIWQYWDNTEDGYVENHKNKNIIRKCRNVNGYLVNEKYPWMFASVDRLINREGGINFITGEPLEKEGILECKNLGYFSSKSWEDGFPVNYIIQVHHYMIVMETDYAEIAMLVDGGNFVVEKIYRDDELAEKIINITKRFWYERVLPGKEAYQAQKAAEASGSIKLANDNEGIVQHLEPPADDSDAYTQFMLERFEKERDALQGGFEMYDLGKRDRYMKQMMNRLDKERTLIKNLFVKELTREGSDTMEFGKKGRVSWSQRKNSKSRTFSNNIKDKPNEEYLDQEFEKLDPNF